MKIVFLKSVIELCYVLCVREHSISEISKTGNNSNINWGRCPYFLNYCLEKIVNISSAALSCHSGHFIDQEFF